MNFGGSCLAMPVAVEFLSCHWEFILEWHVFVFEDLGRVLPNLSWLGLYHG